MTEAMEEQDIQETHTSMHQPKEATNMTITMEPSNFPAVVTTMEKNGLSWTKSDSMRLLHLTR